jgi:predicted glycoside hydrolase/deacetylase ChbG (UPF0249 family)
MNVLGSAGSVLAASQALATGPGMLIMNADDWGRTVATTDRTAECVERGAVSAVSAMVFMEDSERAAAIALDRGIDAGLHLNFTTPFSAAGSPTRLIGHQEALARYLRRSRLAQVVFHPRLTGAFEYVVAAQLDEFRRLYGTEPDRLDGHHHMHLCANVLFQKLMPAGTLVRRSFSFQRTEKSAWNRLYRRFVDFVLSRRHRMVDVFMSLAPLEPSTRLQRIFAVARRCVVELETHPIQSEEHRFLGSAQMRALSRDVRIAPPSMLDRSRPARVDRG